MSVAATFHPRLEFRFSNFDFRISNWAVREPPLRRTQAVSAPRLWPPGQFAQAPFGIAQETRRDFLTPDLQQQRHVIRWRCDGRSALLGIDRRLSFVFDTSSPLISISVSHAVTSGVGARRRWRRLTGQLSDAGDQRHALGDADGSARVEDVKQVRALQSEVVHLAEGKAIGRAEIRIRNPIQTLLKLHGLEWHSVCNRLLQLA